MMQSNESGDCPPWVTGIIWGARILRQKMNVDDASMTDAHL